MNRMNALLREVVGEELRDIRCGAYREIFLCLLQDAVQSVWPDEHIFDRQPQVLARIRGDMDVWRSFLHSAGLTEQEFQSAVREIVVTPLFGEGISSQQYLAVEAGHWSAALLGWIAADHRLGEQPRSKRFSRPTPEVLLRCLWLRFDWLRAEAG